MSPTPTAAPTPVGARYSPKTSRSAEAHSPVVPPAWARAMVASMMFSSVPATRRSSSRARATASPSRPARQRSSSATVAASTAGSTRRIDSSPPRGDSAVSVKRLTPTTTCSPDSMRRTRSVLDATRRPLSSSMAAKAPPRASTSSSSAWAASTSSSVRASTTWDPAKMSSCSSRSVS